MMNALMDFVGAEREHYEDKDNNLFAFAFGQASRYYEFITIIARRHDEASRRMVDNVQISMKLTAASNGNSAATNEQIRLFTKGHELAILVHLETESFYLFAKILLDKLALFLQRYFGEARGISLISHDKLTKSHEMYRVAKHLVFPDGFGGNLDYLKKHVCDYRDKQISHLHNPRTIKATIWNAEGQTKIAATQLYPDPSRPYTQVESGEVPDLMKAIDLYISQVIDIVKSNRMKTQFRLKASG